MRRERRRRWALLGILLPATAPAWAQGVRELALAWVQGDFRAPLACVVDGVPREALRRVRIHAAPAQAPRPAALVTFFDLDAPAGTHCTSMSGGAEPNVLGTLELVWEARSHADTGQVDFRNTLRREGGFDFKVESGRLRVGPTEDGVAGQHTIDFAGCTARVAGVAAGSDAARRLESFGGHRQLLLKVEAPGQAPLAFELTELAPR